MPPNRIVSSMHQKHRSSSNREALAGSCLLTEHSIPYQVRHWNVRLRVLGACFFFAVADESIYHDSLSPRDSCSPANESLWGDSNRLHVPAKHRQDRLGKSTASLHGMQIQPPWAAIEPCLPRPRQQRTRWGKRKTARSEQTADTLSKAVEENVAPTKDTHIPVPVAQRPISARVLRSQLRRANCSVIEKQRNQKAAAVYSLLPYSLQ